MIVDPLATETRCTEADSRVRRARPAVQTRGSVGVFSIYLDGIEVLDEPVYNMAPPAGVPAELGFNAAGIGLICTSVAGCVPGGDYGLSADILDISQQRPIYGFELTLWGEPSAASHDEERGLCAEEKAKQSFKKTGIHKAAPWKGQPSRF